jgi:hypothetical protein
MIIQGIPGILATVYLLSLAAYEPRAGQTDTIRLAHFAGSPGDADAPLWVRRLPPRKFVCFTQPRAFAARLVGGLTDIPVKPVLYVSLFHRISGFYRLLFRVISPIHHPDPLGYSLGHASLPYVFPRRRLTIMHRTHTHII